MSTAGAIAGARRLASGALGVRALTLRGRALVAAGLSAGACGLALGERDLLRVGVLLLALPLGALAVARRRRAGLRAQRTPATPRVVAGDPCRVRLDVVNTGSRSTGVLLASELVAGASRQPPRFVLDRLGAGGRQALVYTVRLPLRGRWVVGPLAVRARDPLGLAQARSTVPGTSRVAVVPVVEPLVGLAPLGLPTGRAAQSDGGDRSGAGWGGDGAGTREYRSGDDLRRVHWRSTARHGEIMVRLEEQVQRHHACVLLDVRRRAHRGTGPAGSFEQAVSAAASITAVLLAEGFTTRTTTTSPDPTGRREWVQDWVQGSAALDVVLEELVDVALDARAVDGDTGSEQLASATERAVVPPPGGAGVALVVAVLGRVDARDATALGAAPRGRRGAAVLVEPPGPGVVATLAQSGWTVLEVGRGQSLATAWGRAPAQTVDGAA